MPLVRQAEYARRRGLSRQAVAQRVLSLNCDMIWSGTVHWRVPRFDCGIAARL